MQCYKNLALHLGFTEEEYIKAFENVSHPVFPLTRRMLSTNRLHDIIKQWVEWYPGDSRGTTNFPTYSRLRRALLDKGFGDVVRELPRDISGLSEGQRP